METPPTKEEIIAAIKRCAKDCELFLDYSFPDYLDVIKDQQPGKGRMFIYAGNIADQLIEFADLVDKDTFRAIDDALAEHIIPMKAIATLTDAMAKGEEPAGNA